MHEPDLPALLQQMLTDIQDHDCYYWLRTNYFDILPPTERTTTRWSLTPLFINYDAILNPALEEDGILLDVILKKQLPEQWERIRIPFDQLYSLSRFHMHQPNPEPDVYYDPGKINFSRSTD